MIWIIIGWLLCSILALVLMRLGGKMAITLWLIVLICGPMALLMWVFAILSEIEL